MTANARPSILEFDWSACMEKFELKLYQIVAESQKKLTGVAS